MNNDEPGRALETADDDRWSTQPRFWRSPLVDMGAGEEFTRVYDRGPLALHALRTEIGDDAFFRLLKEWPATYGGKNASFDELEAVREHLAGRDLDAVHGRLVPRHHRAGRGVPLSRQSGQLTRRPDPSPACRERVDQPRWHPWVLAKGANPVDQHG